MKKNSNLNDYSITNFLVSLKSLSEISDDIINEVDILDLKDPLNGSIGSWELIQIKKAVSLYKSKVKISATLGDIFDNNEFLKRLDEFDKLKLDFIKFGLLSNKEEDLFEKINLISMKKYKTPLVCVGFVDYKKTKNLIINKLNFLNNCGVKFFLLDTYNKDKGDLLNFCEISFLKNLIFECKKYNIKVGLAGGLKENQISSIINLKPNILGFRSAVCLKNKRNSSIQLKKIKRVSSYFNLCRSEAIERAGA